MTGYTLSRQDDQLNSEKYKNLVDGINDVVFQTDINGNWNFLSQSWKRIMDYEIIESIGKPFVDFVHPDDVQDNLNFFSPLIAGLKDHCSHETRYVNKSGRIVWIKVFAILVKDEMGNITGASGTLRDVSEDKENREMRKKAEEQILKSLQNERELNRLKSNFVSLASHEFRTPLAIIRSSVELTEIYSSKKEHLIPYVLKHTKNMLSEIDRLNDLIDEVLTVSKIESQIFTCKKEILDLVTLMEGLIYNLEKIQPDGQMAIFKTRGHCRTVMADPLLLRHAITNLVSNAFKYSAGQQQPVIELIFNDNDYQIKVTDFGIGIPPESHDKIFQAFHRAENVKGIKGTGLGMFITKNFVELHGGLISFVSRAGKTEFTITLNA